MIPYINSTERAIGIGIHHNGIILPSPLTNFIKQTYRNKGNSIKSQENAARTIVRCMNFLYSKIQNNEYKELKLNGLSSIKLQHLADYITSRSVQQRTGNLAMVTVKNDILYLNQFYKWLVKEKIVCDQNLEKLLMNYSGSSKALLFKELNLFQEMDLDIIFPTKNKGLRNLHDFGSNRNLLIAKFIKIAFQVEPSIVLGITLQFFGGLRRSEVLNLTRNSIKNTNNNIIIEIRDNQHLNFPNIESTVDLQVKKERDQPILNANYVDRIYDFHLNNITKTKAKNANALFLSPLTGNSMRAKVYSTKFNNVKKYFLEELLEEGNIEDYLMLTNNKWSTHIGRGIFTNILISYNLNAREIQLARGDNNPNSTQDYVDEAGFISIMDEVINNFSKLLPEIN